MPSYDPNNIFAKILRGELPCYKVYEDDKVLAFLDIMPRAPGHTLVLPKAPARNILDIGADDLAHVVDVAQKIAKAAMKVFSADGITIQQFNEGAGGQVVFHLHLHVIPRKTGVAMKPPASEKEKPDVLAEHAKALAAAIGELVHEKESAKQQCDFARDDTGKYRALHPQISTKGARRRTDADRQRYIREFAARKQDQFRDHTGQERRRYCAGPYDQLGIFVEATRRQQSDNPPHFIRQEADKNEYEVGAPFDDRCFHCVASRTR